MLVWLIKVIVFCHGKSVKNSLDKKYIIQSLTVSQNHHGLDDLNTSTNKSNDNRKILYLGSVVTLKKKVLI